MTPPMKLLWAMMLPIAGRASSPARPGFNDVVKELRNDLWQTCSVTEVLGNRTYMSTETSTQLQCGTLVSTNCTISYRSRCPDECPFVAPHHSFPCFFVCSAQEDCAVNNPERALPDTQSHMCRWCPVSGCSECSNPRTCKVCHEGFYLTKDNTCEFELDRNTFLNVLSMAGKIFFNISIVVCVVWYCMKGGHARARQNMQAILRARRHRMRTKVQSWHLGGKPFISHRYSLFTDISENNILGVGLPLFYNAIGFTIFAAAVFFAVTTYVFSSTDAKGALEYFNVNANQLRAGAVHPLEMAPAVVVSRLTNCRSDTAGYIRRAMSDFATSNFYALGVLYVTLFVAKVVYGVYQKRFKYQFDRQNGTMSDFALLMSGFPSGATDEGELRQWAQKALDEHIAPGHEVDGVSIMYDYTDKELWGQVDSMEDRMMVLMEAAAYQSQGDLPNVDKAKLGESRAEDSKKVHEWFHNGVMKSSGHVIVVMKRASSVRKICNSFKSSQSGALQYKGSAIQTKSLHSEPPSVNWWHAGRSHSEMKRNLIKTISKVVLYIALIQLCIVYPYAKHILLPYSRIGKSAGGFVVGFGGQVIGIINMIFGIWTWQTCFGIGFKFKESMDTLTLFLNTTTSLVNVGLNIIIMWAMVNSKNMSQDALTSFFQSNLISVSADNDMAHNIFDMMMPGYFFVGSLMTIVMAGIWPYVFNTFLMKVVYVWRAGPDFLLNIIRAIIPHAPPSLDVYSYQNAEMAMEPMEVQIGDYGNLIVIPTICSFMLIFVSPFTPMMFKMMLAWTVFYYCFCRYMHLRFCRAAYFTTDIIDNCFNFMWSLPLAVIGFAWCLWGIRSQILFQGYSASFHLAATLAWGLACGVLFAVVFKLVVKPFESKEVEQEQDWTLDEVREHLLYDWYNCNPVFALKCFHYHQDQHGELIEERNLFGHPLASGKSPGSIRRFRVGKEYLCVAPSDLQAAVKQSSYPGDMLEIEYWVEKGFKFLDVFTHILRGKWHEQAAQVSGEIGPLLADFEEMFLADPSSVSKSLSQEGKASLLAAECAEEGYVAVLTVEPQGADKVEC